MAPPALRLTLPPSVTVVVVLGGPHLASSRLPKSRNPSRGLSASLTPWREKWKMMATSIGEKVPYRIVRDAWLTKSSGVILPSGERAHASRTTFSTRSISWITCERDDDEGQARRLERARVEESRGTHVVEGDALGVADLAAGHDLADRVELVEDGVRQLVARELVDDALELALVDVAVLVRVEVAERLAQALALEALDELGELAARERVVRQLDLLGPSNEAGAREREGRT